MDSLPRLETPEMMDGGCDGDGLLSLGAVPRCTRPRVLLSTCHLMPHGHGCSTLCRVRRFRASVSPVYIVKLSPTCGWVLTCYVVKRLSMRLQPRHRRVSEYLQADMFSRAPTAGGHVFSPTTSCMELPLAAQHSLSAGMDGWFNGPWSCEGSMKDTQIAVP